LKLIDEPHGMLLATPTECEGLHRLGQAQVARADAIPTSRYVASCRPRLAARWRSHRFRRRRTS